MIKISVIMSVYNGEKFLSQSLESIINQTYSNFEFIIIDDGSSDNSVNIINSFSKRDHRIITKFNKENIGLTKNLNSAIMLSKGKYIARMDADDISDITRLYKQVRFLDYNDEIDLVGSASVDIDEYGEAIYKRTVPETHKEIIKLLPKANPITHSTVMFRKTSFARINFYNEYYKTTQDYEMWFRAAGIGLKFHNLEEVLLKYRIDNNYLKRKSFTYRYYDFKLRINSFKYIDLPYFRYYYALIPLILGLAPKTLYTLLKKMDPRVTNLN